MTVLAAATAAAGGSPVASWPFGVGAGGIALAAIIFLLRPLLYAYLKERAEREKARLAREKEQAEEGREGWKTALATEQRRMDSVESQMQALRDRVANLESELNREKQANIRLTALLSHANARVAELEAAWPPDRTMPRPRHIDE